MQKQLQSFIIFCLKPLYNGIENRIFLFTVSSAITGNPHVGATLAVAPMWRLNAFPVNRYLVFLFGNSKIKNELNISDWIG
jgi:hypothetical protein